MKKTQLLDFILRYFVTLPLIIWIVGKLFYKVGGIDYPALIVYFILLLMGCLLYGIMIKHDCDPEKSRRLLNNILLSISAFIPLTSMPVWYFAIARCCIGFALVSIISLVLAKR